MEFLGKKHTFNSWQAVEKELCQKITKGEITVGFVFFDKPNKQDFLRQFPNSEEKAIFSFEPSSSKGEFKYQFYFKKEEPEISYKPTAAKERMKFLSSNEVVNQEKINALHVLPGLMKLGEMFDFVMQKDWYGLNIFLLPLPSVALDEVTRNLLAEYLQDNFAEVLTNIADPKFLNKTLFDPKCQKKINIEFKQGGVVVETADGKEIQEISLNQLLLTAFFFRKNEKQHSFLSWLKEVKGYSAEAVSSPNSRL